MRDMAAAATAKHQFPSDILDCCNHIQTFHIEDYAVPYGSASDESTPDLLVGGFGMSRFDVSTLQTMTNGTSPMAGAIDKAVAAAAPSRVRVPRPANPPWTDVDRLPR